MNLVLFVDGDNIKYKNVIKKIDVITKKLKIDSDILYLKNFENEKLDVKKYIKNKTFIIPIGGDGTIIKAIKLFYKYNVIIIPYNIGHLGYLSDINDINEIEKIILNEKHYINEKYLIRAKIIRNNKTIYEDIAQNEFLISTDKQGFMGKYLMSYIKNDEYINEFHSDGIICATATGSTGYSLSNGGPIVDDNIKCIIISTIRSHSVGSRSLILDINKGIKIIIKRNNQIIKIDGRQQFELEQNDIVNITLENKKVKIASLNKYNQIEKVNRRIKGI